ncbi:MAG: DUF3570 domain-containing protein [Chlorobiaceae bacterium]|nr:DUF3570 domain-containing protein [Chlorobiaceae bacterium]
MALGLTTKSTVFSILVASAAMLSPSPKSIYAEAAPDRAIVGIKYLNYHDSQSGDTAQTAGMTRDRINVNALSFMGMVPIAGKWSISATFIEDSITGASPLYHSSGFPSSSPKHDAASGASGELRHAGDISVTRYFSRGTLSAGATYSQESDYISRGLSLNGTLSTEDKNTTLSLGTAYNRDTIALDKPAVDPAKFQLATGRKKVYSGLVGLTQVVSKNDIVQLNLTYTHGHGYYSDPYKAPDLRPDHRNIYTVMTRWNHHFEGTDGTGRLSYRYYSDTFGVRAHTFDAEYVQPLSKGWVLTPLVRFHSQSAADFYVPVGASELNDPATPTPPPAGASYYSEDQRLSAFGAFSYGLKVSRDLGRSWLADVRYEQYQQRYNWCINGHGDPGIAYFNIRDFQLGFSRKF